MLFHVVEIVRVCVHEGDGMEMVVRVGPLKIKQSLRLLINRN